MGLSVARLLLRAGHDVVACDLDDERVALLLADGGRSADLGSVGEQCRVVITSLPSSAAATAVLGAGSPLYGRMEPESVVIETSTLSADDKVVAAAVAASDQVHLLDCPLSGTGHQAVTGDLVALLSGDSDSAKSLATPVIAAFTRAVYDVGGLGAGSKLKLVANMLVAVHNAAAAEAVLLARRAGLDLETAVLVLTDGAGNSRMLEVRAPLMVRRDYQPPGMRISTFQKDLDLVRDLGEQLGCATPLFAATHDLYRSALSQGLGDQDTAAVYETLDLLARQAGQELGPAGRPRTHDTRQG